VTAHSQPSRPAIFFAIGPSSLNFALAVQACKPPYPSFSLHQKHRPHRSTLHDFQPVTPFCRRDPGRSYRARMRMHHRSVRHLASAHRLCCPAWPLDDLCAGRQPADSSSCESEMSHNLVASSTADISVISIAPSLSVLINSNYDRITNNKQHQNIPPVADLASNLPDVLLEARARAGPLPQ